jgi:xylulokinase
MELLLGIDFGTGGCKVSAIDFAGNLVGEASSEYTTYHDHAGWSEQEPDDWYASLRASLATLKAKGVELASCRACALDGSTHNAVLLDDAFRPIRRTIMWTDQRSVAECERLRHERGDDLFRTCYQMPAPTWTLPQLMWLRAHEPDVIARTRHILFVKDYVRFLLTGEALTDRIEAQGTLFFDMARQKWDEELVQLAGLAPEALPRLAEPTHLAGRVTARAAAETGLPEGMPVVCGTSDSAAEDYGAGAVEPDDLIIKLATAGNVNAMTAEPHPHPKTLTYGHIIPGMWYSVSATNAAALCMRWLRDTFYAPSTGGARAEDSPRRIFSLIDDEASASPVGASGVMFHPYLQGERCPYWDADLRASFTGVSISSTRGDFARALMEGVAFSLRDCYRTLEEMALPVKRIFLIGGGARSAIWSEIVANVFNRPVAVPSPGDASFGAALLAGVGIGLFADVRAAVATCLHIDRTVAPDPAAAALYARLFARYRAVHDALAPVYSQKEQNP